MGRRGPHMVHRMTEIALRSLREQCEAQGKQIHYGLFDRYDLAEVDRRATYASLAAEFGLCTYAVTNYLS